MVTMFIHYRPSLFFGLLSAVNFAGAASIGLRFIYLVYLVPASWRAATGHIFPRSFCWRFWRFLAPARRPWPLLRICCGETAGCRRKYLYQLRRQAVEQSCSNQAPPAAQTRV